MGIYLLPNAPIATRSDATPKFCTFVAIEPIATNIALRAMLSPHCYKQSMVQWHKYLIHHQNVLHENRPLQYHLEGCTQTLQCSQARTEHMRTHTRHFTLCQILVATREDMTPKEAQRINRDTQEEYHVKRPMLTVTKKLFAHKCSFFV